MPVRAANSQTGESVPIAASKALSFKAGKALRDAVNTGWKPAVADRADDRDLGKRDHGERGAAFDVPRLHGRGLIGDGCASEAGKSESNHCPIDRKAPITIAPSGLTALVREAPLYFEMLECCENRTVRQPCR